MVLKNLTKAKLADGQPVFGCFVRTAAPSLIEYVALLGWDFLVLDGEHGTLQPDQVEDLCRAIEPRGVTPLVRVTTNDPPTILRYLDTGAHGAHVPWVNSPAEAERAVRSVKYSPRGIRGLAGSRASEWALREPLAGFVEPIEPRDARRDPDRDAGRGRRDRRHPGDRRRRRAVPWPDRPVAVAGPPGGSAPSRRPCGAGPGREGRRGIRQGARDLRRHRGHDQRVAGPRRTLFHDVAGAVPPGRDDRPPEARSRVTKP